MDHAVRSGMLHIQKGSGLVKKFQKKYAALYGRSQHGVARLEVYDNKDGYEKRAKGSKKNVIVLDSCATISRKSVPDGKKTEHQVQLTFDGNKEQLFHAESADDMELWYASMSSVIFGGGGLTDNVIYDQVEQDGYDVVIKQNEMAKKLELSGLYNLHVSAEDIELQDKQTRKQIYKWPLDRLRKYGRDKMEFSLEAGRRCPTGPGMFFFITDHYNEIFQDVDQKVKSLAKNREIRDRATSVSSMKDGKSPTFLAAPPDSPLLLSPSPASAFPKVESEYDNPLDGVQRASAPTQEPIYNDPVDAGRPSIKPSKGKDKKVSPPKKTKPDTAAKKLEGKKNKKKKALPMKLPPSPAPPPGHIEEATYSAAMPVAGAVPTAGDGEYGRLDFQGVKRFSGASGGDDNQYDSINVFKNSAAVNQPDDSEYATAESLNPHFSNLSVGSGDNVYDRVQRS